MHLYKFNNRRTYTFPLVLLLAFVCRNEQEKSDITFTLYFPLKGKYEKDKYADKHRKLREYSSEAPQAPDWDSPAMVAVCVDFGSLLRKNP